MNHPQVQPPAELWQSVDPEDPATIPTYDDYLDQDSRPVPDELRDRGDEPTLGLRTLSADWWTSAEVYRRECERLWRRVWQAACRTNDLPTVGDSVRYQCGDLDVLVIRESVESIAAVHAACRHRGTRLGPENVSQRGVFCPSHGWGYSLDGRLRDVPCRWDFDGLQLDQLQLAPLQVDVWDGWVFVNPDRDAPPLADFIGDRIWSHFQRWPKATLHKGFHVGKVVPANWKLLVNAFNETYHFARTHPELRSIASELSTAYDIFGEHGRIIVPQAAPSLQVGAPPPPEEVAAAWLGPSDEPAPTAPDEVAHGIRRRAATQVRMTAAARGLDTPGFCDAELVDAVQYCIFPNFFPWGGPTPTVAGGFRFRPWRDETTSLVEVFGLFVHDGPEPMPRDAPLRILAPDERLATCPELEGMMTGQILEQDIAIAVAMQEGLRTDVDVHLGARQERLLSHFYERLAARLE